MSSRRRPPTVCRRNRSSRRLQRISRSDISPPTTTARKRRVPRVGLRQDHRRDRRRQAATSCLDLTRWRLAVAKIYRSRIKHQRTGGCRRGYHAHRHDELPYSPSTATRRTLRAAAVAPRRSAGRPFWSPASSATSSCCGVSKPVAATGSPYSTFRMNRTVRTSSRLLRPARGVRYFDHHFAGDLPAHPGFDAHINTGPMSAPAASSTAT